LEISTVSPPGKKFFNFKKPVDSLPFSQRPTPASFWASSIQSTHSRAFPLTVIDIKWPLGDTNTGNADPQVAGQFWANNNPVLPIEIILQRIIIIIISPSPPTTTTTIIINIIITFYY